MEKKRKRNKNKPTSDDDEMDIEDEEEIRIDDTDKVLDMIKVEFTFSNLLEIDFHSMRELLKPLFEFQDINIGDLVDVLLSQNEDVGTSIRTDDQIFGVFSYIPLTYYRTLKEHNKVIDKFYKYLENKIEQCIKDEEKKKKAKEIILSNKYNIGLVVNERVFNMPQETIPPAMGLITKEINECKEYEDYDKRYEFDYLVYISKFVKIIEKKVEQKKRNLGGDGNNEAFYKYEAPLMVNKSEFDFEYRVPYKERNIEYLENQNEPQYVKVCIISEKNYYDVLKNDLGCTI